MPKEHPLSTDEKYMALACRLARRGEGKTSPNPMVGAVLVKSGRIIGTGYHKKPGAPHAEIAAFRNAEASLKGATLYVNLEPCAHYGKTPPCVDSIIAEKIRRVVIGAKDPNPLVKGRSIRRLKKQGVAVTCGVMESQCRRLNEAFYTSMETGKPLKMKTISSAFWIWDLPAPNKKTGMGQKDTGMRPYYFVPMISDSWPTSNDWKGSFSGQSNGTFYP